MIRKGSSSNFTEAVTIDHDPGASTTDGALTITGPDAGENSIAIPEASYIRWVGANGNLFYTNSNTIKATNNLGATNLNADGTVTAGTTLQSQAANGANGLSFTTNGARLKLGTGTNDYFYSDGVGLKTDGYLNVNDATYGIASTMFRANAAAAAVVKGQQADGAAAIGVKSETGAAYTTAGAKIHSFQNNAVEKAFVDKDGNIELNGANELGVIMKSPDGTRYKLTIANGGTVTVTAA